VQGPSEDHIEEKEMNAKEAKLAAQKRAAEIQKKKEDDERREAEQSAKKWKDARARWFKDECLWIERKIAAAVEKGETKTDVWLASSEKPENATEKAFWERFTYKPELKKVIAIFKDLGYQLEFSVNTKRHVDLSDLNPQEDSYTYETTLDISW
jgi:hypothetical protein